MNSCICIVSFKAMRRAQATDLFITKRLCFLLAGGLGGWVFSSLRAEDHSTMFHVPAFKLA